MQIHNLVWYFIAVITPALAMLFVKYYTHNKNKIWILYSMVCYLVFIKACIELIDNTNLIVLYALIKILSILMVTLLDYLFIGDKLDMQSKIGILLGIVSIYLLYNKTKN